MLYLNPPYLVIDGISIFGDYDDPLQFYYLPLYPQLSLTPDKKPSIQLIKYRGSAGDGGFLNFDVNIGVPQSTIDDLGNQIQRKLNLSGPPKMATVPVVDGWVKLIMLGVDTSDAPTPTAAAGGAAAAAAATAANTGLTIATGDSTRFVIKAEHSAKPSLYGDEQASFSVQLDTDGVAIVEKALNGEIQPIGVVYSLDYLGLRPAYNVSLSIDWDRVQQHLSQSLSVGSMLSSAEIDNVIDQLVEKRIIVINVTTEVEETDANKGTLARRDAAMGEVRDMIINTFFESSIPPPKANMPDNTMQQVGAEIATGGMCSLFGSFSYKKVDMTRIDHKALNVNINERTTVRHTIYPQGHLAGIAAVLRQPGVNISDFIIAVDLNDPWFQRRRVTSIARADFAGDSIDSINVQLQYGNQPQNVILDGNTPTADVQWNSIINSGKFQTEVDYSYQVTFKGVDRTQRPVQLQSPKASTDVEKLEIVPREVLYSIACVPVTALDYPWARYPYVQVDLKYDDDANNIHLAQPMILSPQQTGALWQMFLVDPTKRTFQYKVTHRGADNHNVEWDWQSTDEELVVVGDPYPSALSMMVVTQLNWTLVDQAFVDLYYDNPAANESETTSFTFNANNPTPQTWTLHPHDPTVKTIGYEVTILFKNGTNVQVPRSYTVDKRILVRADMKGHQLVFVHPDNSMSFSDAHVTQMTVDLQYVDSTAGLSFSDSFTFKAGTDKATFEFDFVDKAKTKYQYRVTYLSDNGLSRQTDWTDATGTDLTVPLS